MLQLKNTKGITLTSLVITVVVMSIIAGIMIYNGVSDVQQAKENKALSEVQIVQHAVLEAYTKYSKTKDVSFLAGVKVEESEMATLASALGVTLAIIPEEYDETISAYYRLTPLNLEKIGIYESEDTYIVNYLTGEVINETLQKTRSGKPLYAYPTNNLANDDVTAF